MDPRPSKVDAIVEEILEEVLEGRGASVEERIAAHPELTDEERRRIRARTSLLTGTTPPESAAPPFERLGEFRLIRRLGEGGMGVVFLAEQESLHRQVALKLIRPEHADSRDAAARFEREARAVAALRHEGIVAVHAAGTDRGVHYLAMDLVPGAGLDEVLRSARAAGERIPASRAVRWARDLARALEYAHGMGVVHRDVKPANARITPDDRALLVDFGLARVEAMPALRSSQTFLGSPAYASPEQVEGDPTIDARTDVYSLGATLYECVTGALPFPGTTTEQVLHRILAGAPAPPRRLDPTISRDLETVVLKALERDRARRYASAGALANDLQALLDVRPIEARPAGAIERSWKWCKRNRAAAAALAVAAAAVLAIVGIDAGRRIGRAAEFRGEVAAAEGSLRSGDFDGAIRALDRALALSPDDPTATRRRADAVAARGEAAARDLVGRARAKLTQYRERRAAAEASAREVEPLRRERNTRYLTPAEHARIARAEDESQSSARELERGLFETLELLEQAARANAAEPGIAEARADLWMERWRGANARGDAASAAFFREIVEANDRSRRHAAELHPMGTLRLATDPPGAQAHLFRYRDVADLAPGGEHRLAPIPVGDAKIPTPPGTWCLRVKEALPGFEVNDLITRVAGRPIRDTILVPRTVGEIHAMDRLVSVDGKPIREAYDVSKLYRYEGEGESHQYEFERDGKSFTVETAGIRALGIRAYEPDSIVWEAPCEVELYHEGELRTVQCPGKLVAVTTAAPLFLDPKNRLSPSPVDGLALEPGSYVAFLRAAGREDQRYPFVVEAGRETRIQAALLASGTTPRGFVHVAGGPFRAGGDPASFAGWPAETREIPPFWISEREVTESEYLVFLNDPAENGKASLQAALAETGEAPGYDIHRKPDGSYATRAGPGMPMSAMTWKDAAAYADWYSRRMREQGIPLAVSLPTEEEWEKAARGADGRPFVFGHRFDPTWVKSRFGHDEVGKEYVLRFPVDESPYGVFDLTGSLWEWTADRWDSNDSTARTVRGGAWSFIYEANFRSASRAELTEDTPDPTVGIRLVARPLNR